MIRNALPKDLPDFLELRAASIRLLAQTHYTAGQIEDWVANCKPDKMRLLFETGPFFIGQTDQGAMTCGGGWQGDEISHFYVSPQFIRQGWGARLLQVIEQDYCAKTANDYVRAEASNNARAFYEANGYLFIEERKGDDGRMPYTYSVMRKEF